VTFVVDPKAARRALVKADGSVFCAARKLGIPPQTLRTLIRADPRILAEANERIERELDRAEQALRDGLKRNDRIDRLNAALAIVRLSGRFRKPGRRAKDSPQSLPDTQGAD
jgi:hypothetical protein